MRFPKKLRVIFALLWLRQDQKGRPASRFIIKGPRGGGKSKLLGAIGFVIWYLLLRDIIDMGGSLEQAKGVYNYFAGHIYAQENIARALPDEPTMHRTQTDKGNYFRAVAASQKQVRGPHPQVLFIDEACETKDELILSALPMVDTADEPLVVATSTFHKIFGWFQETWDDAERLGWVRLSWDIFDVCKTFDHKIWDDKRLNKEIPDLALLKKRAAGRTGDPEGWVPVENIIQAWREKPTVDYFDIEYMGSRPSITGMVNDPEDVDACTVPTLKDAEISYVAGAETAGGIDWGFSGMTAWDLFMAHKDNIKAQLESRTWSNVRSSVIIEDIVADVLKYRVRTIHADASHPFENADLRAALNKATRDLDFRCSLIEVPFGRPVLAVKSDREKKDKTRNLGTEKEQMLGNYRAYWQRRLVRIPIIYKTALWQHKRFRYEDNSEKTVKKDDHHPDATMLAWRRWPLGKIASRLPEEDSRKRTNDKSTVTKGLLDEVF